MGYFNIIDSLNDVKVNEIYVFVDNPYSNDNTESQSHRLGILIC